MRALALVAAAALDEKSDSEVVILDVSESVVVTDYFVIGSGRNDRQVKALVENVERRLRETGVKPIRREGVRAGRWGLLDYGDFVVHVFLDEVRGFYDLERLWSDAPRVEFESTLSPTR